MRIVDENVENYVENALGLFEGDLGELQNYAYNKGFPVISVATARFLSTLLSALRPKEILEIGCCVGFSAMLMNKYSNGAHITTIDRYDIMIEQAKMNFAKYGLQDKITLIEADAVEMLPKLEKKFDFIFIDAAKGQYLQFLYHCVRLLNVGGVLVADDVMSNGYIANSRFTVPRRQRTTHKRMREFIHEITHCDGLEYCIIPCDDGLVMCTKTKEIVTFKGLSDFEYEEFENESEKGEVDE